MFSQNACGPLIERLEERQLFSGHFVAPDGSPYLFGRYTMTLTADPTDSTQFSESHVVTIKKHDGPSFGGWMWGGQRQKISGSWNAKFDDYHFEVVRTSSIGHVTNRGTMLMYWDPGTQEFTGYWAYHRGKTKFMNATFTMVKSPVA